MSRVLVFVGPTLAGDALPAGFERLAPAAAGDMLAAAPQEPATLVLIDGLFGVHRAPWHKEILALMAAGHRVIGAASMGALRHAELWLWGMEGAGVVARAYRRGVLVDDGDVAVAHAPAELGFRPLSVALVDVRATLSVARRAGVLTAAEARALAVAAAAIFFPERTWEGLCASAGAAGARLLAALPRVERQLKRADALAALALAGRARSAKLPPLPIAAPPDTGVLELIRPKAMTDC
jgi:hypothetical protein